MHVCVKNLFCFISLISKFVNQIGLHKERNKWTPIQYDLKCIACQNTVNQKCKRKREIVWFERALSEWVWLYRKLFGTSKFCWTIVSVVVVVTSFCNSIPALKSQAGLHFHLSKCVSHSNLHLNISMIESSSSHSQLLSLYTQM